MCLVEAKVKNDIKKTISGNQLSMTIIIILKSLKIIGKKRVKKNETKRYRKNKRTYLLHENKNLKNHYSEIIIITTFS